MQPQKISLKNKIIAKFNIISSKIKEKYKKNQELKAFVSMGLDIIITGGLIFLGYHSLTSNSWILRLLGFGSIFWLIKNKVIGMITEVLGSVRLVTIK